MSESRFAELKEREKQARRKIVMESASALFAKKPFYEVGMREVAEEAGISPATIYRYFPSQEELFHETFLYEISKAMDSFQVLVEKESPASIEEFAINFIYHIRDNESAFQMMSYLMLKENLGTSFLGKFDSVTKVIFQLFAKLLERHGVDEREAHRHSQAFIASLAGILMTFRNYPSKDEDAVVEFIISVVKTTSKLYSDQLLRN